MDLVGKQNSQATYHAPSCPDVDGLNDVGRKLHQRHGVHPGCHGHAATTPGQKHKGVRCCNGATQRNSYQLTHLDSGRWNQTLEGDVETNSTVLELKVWVLPADIYDLLHLEIYDKAPGAKYIYSIELGK